MLKPVCPLISIPISDPVPAPLQAVWGSACPVIVKPFNSSVTDAPMTMQGAPVTVQVTSSTNWLSSVIVNVVEIVPPMSVALATPEQTTNTLRHPANHAAVLRKDILSS
jgi:hypothetical protein